MSIIAQKFQEVQSLSTKKNARLAPNIVSIDIDFQLDLTLGPLAPAISAAAAVGVRRNPDANQIIMGDRIGASLAARRQA